MAKKNKAPKTPKKPKDPIKKENFRKRLVGLLIGLVGVFLLLFVIFYTVSRVFRPVDFATMLPKDNTIALMQVNVNKSHEQVRRFYNALNKFETYHPNSIENMLNEQFDINYEKEIKLWLNRQIGFAVLKKDNEESLYDLVYFFETKNISETKDFMESRGLESQDDYLLNDEYNGEEIYRYALSQSYNFVFLNNYMIVSESQGALKQIVDTHNNSDLRLIESPDYQKISQNLPITTLLFGYVDVAKLVEYLKTNEEFMADKGMDLLAFEPFLKIYKSYGLTGMIENKNFAVQTFTVLDKGYLGGKDLLNFDSKFQAEFLKLLPEDVKAYSGGMNLTKQFQRYSEIFGVGGEVSYLIFEGALRSLKSEYFGDEIELEADLFPILQKEYLIAVTGEGPEQATTLMFGLKDPVNDKNKISNIAESFVRKSALLAPKVVEVELEDGTKAEEIVTSEDTIEKTEEEYHGYSINSLDVGDPSWGIYYILLDDQLIISTKLETIKSIIDLFIDSSGNFRSSTVFRENVSPVLRTSDEIIFLDTHYVIDNYFSENPEWMAGYLEPFSVISIGKNYFKDGISTINYIKIK